MSETIPFEVQEKLLLFADELPADKRSKFIQTVTREVFTVVEDHPRTIIYAALGWVLGEIIDQLLTFKLPFKDIFICLTADCASDLGAAAGLVTGFIEDRKAIAERDQMSRVVAKGIKDALGDSHEKK